MVDYSSLQPNTRSQALVGTFLQMWSFLEAELNDTVQAALGLGNLEAVVVSKNVQLRDKIHIVKTMIGLRFRENSDDHKNFRKLLEDVRNASADRNMIAHEMFGPDEDGDGVEFLITRAKGKLTFPKTKWSISEFEEKYSTLISLTKKLGEFRAKIAKQTKEAKELFPDTPTLAELGLQALLRENQQQD